VGHPIYLTTTQNNTRKKNVSSNLQNIENHINYLLVFLNIRHLTETYTGRKILLSEIRYLYVVIHDM
jgi:hypothetical protein